MFSIINKTGQVVLCRFNSGLELNLAPLARIDQVADAEVRDNRDLGKLVRLGVIEMPSTLAAGARQAVAARSAARRTPAGRGKARRARSAK
jgi:hypothetical protein